LAAPKPAAPRDVDMGGSHNASATHSETGHQWHTETRRSAPGKLKEAVQAADHIVSGGHNTKTRREKETKMNEGRDWIGLLALPIVVLYLFLGSLMFISIEGFEARDSWYFCVTMLTTVGYGDFSPATDAGKIGAIFYIMIGLSLVTTCIGIIFARSADLTAKSESPSSVKLPTVNSQIWKMARALMYILIVNIVGALWAHFHDGFSWLDAFYWSLITSTSVGFGDLETSDATRNFNIAYMIIAVGVVANGFGTLVEVIGVFGKIRRIEIFCKAGVSNDMIEKMDTDGDMKVDRLEFLTYMLVNLGKVDQDDVDLVMSLFTHYDLDGSGTINKDDVVHLNTADPDKKV
jgi:hypothetical protein